LAEHETLFGSKPSPSKSGIKAPRCSTGVPNTRKFSVGGAMLQDRRQSTLIQQSNKKGNTTPTACHSTHSIYIIYHMSLKKVLR
jgi:hypothetical protein